MVPNHCAELEQQFNNIEGNLKLCQHNSDGQVVEEVLQTDRGVLLRRALSEP